MSDHITDGAATSTSAANIHRDQLARVTESELLERHSDVPHARRRILGGTYVRVVRERVREAVAAELRKVEGTHSRAAEAGAAAAERALAEVGVEVVHGHTPGDEELVRDAIDRCSIGGYPLEAKSAEAALNRVLGHDRFGRRVA